MSRERLLSTVSLVLVQAQRVDPKPPLYAPDLSKSSAVKGVRAGRDRRLRRMPVHGLRPASMSDRDDRAIAMPHQRSGQTSANSAETNVSAFVIVVVASILSQTFPS